MYSLQWEYSAVHRFSEKLFLGLDFTMELFQESSNHKSLKIFVLILIAVVLANGRLLFTTGDISLIDAIIVKQDAINSLKYSPKINKNCFCHSHCCSRPYMNILIN